MPVSGFELIGRSGDENGVRRRYRCEDATTEEDIATFIGTLPAELVDFPFSGFRYDEVEEDDPGDGPFIIEASWGNPQGGGHSSGQAVGTSQYRFNFQFAGGRFVQSLATVSYHTATGSNSNPVTVGARNFGGAINVVNTDGKKRVEGQDVNSPPENFTLIYKATDAQMTDTYQKAVEGIVGTVNNATFRGRAAGCVMLVRCQGGKQGGIWTVEYGFSHIPVQTSIPVGDDITVDTKDGHDLLWPYYETVKDNDAKDTLPNPTAAYVERIFYRTDYSILALPA